MRSFYLIVWLAALALATIRQISAEEAVNSPVYAVTYLEVAPLAAGQAAALARQHADASRKEAGNVGFEMFAEIGRPNRLAVLEAWRDKPAYEAHGAAASTAAFRDKLQPL